MLHVRRIAAASASLALALGSLSASATVVDIAFTATDFVGVAGRFELTGEPVPDPEVSGSFHYEAAVPPGPRDYYIVTPTAVDLTIADHVYAPEETEALILLRENGQPWEAVVGSITRDPGDTQSSAIFVMAGEVHDFIFRLAWDVNGNLMQPLPFHPSVPEGGMRSAGSRSPTRRPGRSAGSSRSWCPSPRRSTAGRRRPSPSPTPFPTPTICWDAYLAGDPLRGEIQVGDYFCYAPEEVDEECLEGAREAEGEREAAALRAVGGALGPPRRQAPPPRPDRTARRPRRRGESSAR